MQISLDQARALCAVVDGGGYQRAAESLHKSHSAVIYLIKGLEAQCGFTLFDRAQYRNALTERGHRVYEKCREILGKVEELDQLCRQMDEGWEPAVTLVLDAIIPFSPFLKVYKKFRSEKIPTVVQTYVDYLEDVEKSYRQHQADLMISIVPARTQVPELLRLKSFRTWLVAHKDHPVHRSGKKWNLQELEEFDFLTVRGAGQRLGLSTREFEEKASFFLSDFSSKKTAIMNKVGFGWLPEHMIEKELRAKSLCPVKWERESSQLISPVVYGEKKRGPAVRFILESLKSF